MTRHAASLVQRVRQLLADLLHVLPEFESLKHGRVPLILEQLDERRDAVGGRRSGLDDLASGDGDELVGAEGLAVDGVGVVIHQVLLDQTLLEDRA
jgi:hypothetical protein